MKKALLLFSCFLGLSLSTSFAQELLKQEVSLSLNNASLEEALYKLLDEYGIPLSFSNDLLPEKRITAQLRNRPLEAVLDFLLRNTQIGFRQYGRHIVLFATDYRMPPQPVRRFTINGYLEDSISGERLIGATILDRRSRQGAVTNEYGFFSLSLPAGEVELEYSYLGCKPERLTFDLQEHRQLKLRLNTTLLLEEVLVVASDTSAQGAQVNPFQLEWLDLSDVQGFPALGGEADVLRTTYLLPGVQTGADGIGGLFVRGGEAGHNLVLFDGVPVYNLTHGAGLLSIFNTDALKSVRFIRGAFPARYGGRLASVLDVRTRDGNSRHFQGQIGLGLLSARATVEGPLATDKSSFLISGRWSYLDWLVGPAARQFKESLGEDGSMGFQFHDLTAKINWTPSARDKVFLSYYSGSDQFLNYGTSNRRFLLSGSPGGDSLRVQFNGQYREQLNWGNHVAALRWNHLLSPRLFANTTLTYSHYRVDVRHASRDSLHQETPFRLLGRNLSFGRYFSTVEDLSGRVDFDFIPSAKHYFRFGAAISRYLLSPGVQQFDEQTQGWILGDTLAKTRWPSAELALYAEDDFELGSAIHINAGLRGMAFLTEGRQYLRLEPRLALSWSLSAATTLRAAFSANSQALHLLSSSNLGLPIDLWTPSTAEIAPQTSLEWSMGLDQRLPWGLQLSIDGYYKRMNQLLAYQEGAFFLNNWEESITTGRGRAYGLEFMLRRRAGRFSGWIAYSLGWNDRQYEGINQGNIFPFRYDRRHDFKVVLRHSLTNWLELSADWVFGTGLAFSFPVYSYLLLPSGETVRFFEGKNNFRLPPYHRVDLAANFSFQSKKLDHQFSLGLYNTYDRQNPLYYDLRDQFSMINGQVVRTQQLAQINVIPMLPYLNYSVKF